MAVVNDRQPRERLVFIIVAIVLSGLVFIAYASLTSVGLFRPASLAVILEGQGLRPYTHRVLMPNLAWILAHMLPVNSVGLLDYLPEAIRNLVERFGGDKYVREALLIVAGMYLSLLGFVFAERKFLADLGFDKQQQDAYSLTILMMVLPVNMFTGYYYDFPQLLLMTILLVCLYRRDWSKYLFFLAIATLNKETSVFIVVTFMLYYWKRLPRRVYLLLLIAQGAVFGFIYGLVVYRFKDNPGASVLFTLPDHIQLYARDPSGLLFTVIYLATVVYLILKNWRKKNEYLRSAMCMGLIIFFLFFTSGFPLEFRVFLEVLPVAGILILPPSQKDQPHKVIDKPIPTA